MPIYSFPASAAGGGGGGGSSATFVQNVLTPGFAGQTVFALSGPRIPGGLAILTVNGTEYAEGISYTIAGAVLTWLDVPFTLQTSDSIIVDFQLT